MSIDIDYGVDFPGASTRLLPGVDIVSTHVFLRAFDTGCEVCEELSIVVANWCAPI